MLKKNFTKKELIDKVYQNLGFSKNFSSILIDDFFEVISSELKKMNKVKISSFGTFKVFKKKERTGRNPKTKIPAKILARSVIKFKSSKEIKKKLNS